MRQLLRLHPDSICSAATRIEVEVVRPRAGSLMFSYVVSGKISELRMPPAMAAAHTDELWRHTCFEAFLRRSAGEGYYEFNFAPSTQWAAYRFDSYRSGMRVVTEINAPQIDVQSAPKCFTLHAALDLSALLPLSFPSPARERGKGRVWRLGLSAVIEETSGRKSYWALAHPPGTPDFHHADCFACVIS
jgi:hypothetical protein